MDLETKRLIESIMQLIASEFGPKCEVVLHDWSKPYDKTIIAIKNGAVSGRRVGDGGSNLGLEVMRGTSDGSNHLNYLTKTEDGRMLRSSSLYLEDEQGQKIGALCINYDITEFMNIHQKMSQMTLIPTFDPGEEQMPKEFFAKDVNELLDCLLDECRRIIGKDSRDMTKEEKKQAIHYLDKKGALLITKAGPRICQYLGISKYTLYNYLDELRLREENGRTQAPEKPA